MSSMLFCSIDLVVEVLVESFSVVCVVENIKLVDIAKFLKYYNHENTLIKKINISSYIALHWNLQLWPHFHRQWAKLSM